MDPADTAATNANADTDSGSDGTAPSTADDSADDSGGTDDSTTSTGPSITTDPDGDGSSDATASSETSGEADSGSTGCGDTASDPMNCGDCGHVCPGVSHGAATCDAGACAIECEGDYDQVDVGGATRCSTFAGFFLLRETQECVTPNPFTGDCTCPQGFDDRPVTSWRVQPGDGASWVQLAVCSPIAATPDSPWGGLYARYEDTGSCAFPNPFNIPLCACPNGYTVTSEWLGSNINGDAMRISFCSDEPYEDDALFVGGFTEACNGGCAAGAACSCPAGSARVDYPTVVAGCATTSAFCYAE